MHSKIMIACGLGGLIGGFVASEVMGAFFWWVGIVVGALVAYLAFDFSRVIGAVPMAARRATAWRPNPEFWRMFGAHLLSLGSSISTFSVGFYTASVVRTSTQPAHLQKVAAVAGSVTFITVVLAAAISASLLDPEQKEEELKECRWNAIHFNPFSFYFWFLPKWTMIGMWKAIRFVPTLLGYVPSVIRTVGRFFWHLFKLIHSDMRLLVAADAALGVVIGFTLGNVLLCGAIGAVLGVLSYELISKRLFHIAPSPASE